MTLLHKAAMNNQNVVFRRLIKVAKDRAKSHDNSHEIIRSWVNKQSHAEAFAAIHYGSFNGNLEICQMLLDEGADPNVTNLHGLNCLHVAAQGDQPASLYYFHKVINLDIRSQDHRGSTVLHWSIFQLSELSMSYILSWLEIEDLAQQDKEGQTAMHLAVKKSEELGSTRPVRSLIFYGSPIDIRDKDGKTPQDVAG